MNDTSRMHTEVPDRPDDAAPDPCASPEAGEPSGAAGAESGSAECRFCRFRCRLQPGRRGVCGVRENRGGSVRTTVYGQIVSAGIDPIEKKPLYHFHPGSRTLSIALPGCCFHCEFCQNWQISQYREYVSLFGADSLPYTAPREIARRLAAEGLEIMTYTYSDPVVWQDYMLDTAREVKQLEGGKNCMVTNGYMTPEGLAAMRGLIDACNIDVKGDDAFYRTLTGGSLQPVLENIAAILKPDPADMLPDPAAAPSVPGHVEVTTLVIEGVHTIEGIVRLGAQLREIGVQVWHLSRFFPAYRMLSRKATSEVFLRQALDAAAASGIPFIYSGNSADHRYTATTCPECGTVLMPSHGYGGEAGKAAAGSIRNGSCSRCSAAIYGRF